MRKIIFATHNNGKIIEMREMMKQIDLEIVSASEFGINEEPEENGTTLEENALIKARFACLRSGLCTFADDSGLFIDALGGEPGVRSARWAGDGKQSEEKVAYALDRLKDVPQGERSAIFRSVVAYVCPDGKEDIFDGEVLGEIVLSPRGEPRPKLPYDVLFQPLGYDRTFAQMSDEEKNMISHRGKAFEKFRKFLTALVNS
jgi:XTP/dITP diphosphohydrolase